MMQEVHLRSIGLRLLRTKVTYTIYYRYGFRLRYLFSIDLHEYLAVAHGYWSELLWAGYY